MLSPKEFKWDGYQVCTMIQKVRFKELAVIGDERGQASYVPRYWSDLDGALFFSSFAWSSVAAMLSELAPTHTWS